LITNDIVVVSENGSAIDDSALRSLIDQLGTDPLYGDTEIVLSEDGTVAMVSAVIKTDPSSAAAIDGLTRLRSEHIPAALGSYGYAVYVGGDTASTQDEIDLMLDYLPWVFGFVLGASFLLLMMVFRSIVVPAKAILMNMLSVAAAYGLLVLVFQEGLGATLFGFHQTPVIEFWLPLFLFSILFGLSMDYHVFMLSRIKERYDETGENTAAVVFGLRNTAGIITGAALIMVAVFGGFALGDLSMFQQLGFGLAAAIIIDATLVRSILVPASMELLGDRNWYFPGWLEWLPRLEAEGKSDPVETAPGVPGAVSTDSPALHRRPVPNTQNLGD
jgi:RND superfamily putative drug exporter